MTSRLLQLGRGLVMSAALLFMYWSGTRAVAFNVRTNDTLLLDAIDAAFRDARRAVLLPPGRVQLHVEDPLLWTNSDPVLGANRGLRTHRPSSQRTASAGSLMPT